MTPNQTSNRHLQFKLALQPLPDHTAGSRYAAFAKDLLDEGWAEPAPAGYPDP